MILAEHRRTVFSEHRDIRPFQAGLTVAQIVATFETPLEFQEFGAVYIKRTDGRGHVLERRYWHLVRPKSGTALFISCVPHGGGGSSANKQIFALVATIALIALTAWIGGGGLGFLSPSYLAAGSVGAKIAAAALLIAGSLAIQKLTAQPGVAAPADNGATVTLGVAGISQNTIGAFAQVPAPLGRIRISAPLLARPYTEISDTDQYINLITGVCGPAQISNIKINDTDLADLSDSDIEIETREGWIDSSNDSPLTRDNSQLTLITQSFFEESINLQMGTHRLENDQTTLVLNADSPTDPSDSYPTKHIIRTAGRPDEIRITLAFPQGLIRFDSTSQTVLTAFRVRLRRVGDVNWRALPEMQIEAAIRAPFRQQIRIFFGGVTESDLVSSTSNETPAFLRFYLSNAEWQADSFFGAISSPVAINTDALHIHAGKDRVLVWLDRSQWPSDAAYDIEIQRSFAQNSSASDFDGTHYTGGLFTFRTAGPPNWTIPVQSNFSASVAIENYATMRRVYPIAQDGLALIAVRAKNIAINSISAEFEPYVPIASGSPENWDTVEPSSNPAALVRAIRTGSLNKRASDPDLSQGLEDWYDYCEDHGLRCSALFNGGSVEQAASLAANVGDAIIRESDKWGVVIDKDRSAEGVAHLFGAHNMTSPLTMNRTFLQSSRGIIAQFVDETNDYQLTESAPVFDDGLSTLNSDLLVESAPYDGYSDEDLVRRRAKMDLRRARLRATRYSWETHQEHLVAIHGDLVGVSHDILAYMFGTGRVGSFTTETLGSPAVTYLRTVTLNTDVPDAPQWTLSSPPGMFEVPDVFLLPDVFSISIPELGMQVRLAGGSISTIPVSSIVGRTVTVEGDVELPDGFGKTLLVAIGPRSREVRRVLITAITPKQDYFAQVEAVDEAPGIFTGL
jgi:hypothetical protein